MDVITKKMLIEKVKRMQYPVEQGQQYFEYSSADGFAFLGAAKAMLGLDYGYELQAMQERNYGLNDKSFVGAVEVSKDNQYVYTIWVCLEFLHSAWRMAQSAKQNDLCIELNEKIEMLAARVQAIGIYDDVGMQRYCTEEVNLIVPNVTSAAALIYVWLGWEDQARELITILGKHQKPSGNWEYLARDKQGAWKITREEDCYHVAMMVYHLSQLDKLGIRTWDMMSRSIRWLTMGKPRCGVCNKSDDNWLCEGSVGWGVPMMTLAVSGYNKRDLLLARLEKEGIVKTVKYLDHPNFRVRSMAGWVLAKVVG